MCTVCPTQHVHRRPRPPPLSLSRPTQGRAEPIRLAFHIGGIDFEDERISREAFQAAKTAGEYPFGQLPVMVIDGQTIAQSQGLLRYAGKLAGLYPSDAKQALLVDEMVGAVEDVITATVPALREPDEEKKVGVGVGAWDGLGGTWSWW